MRQPFSSGPNLLADFNFSAPLAQEFPTTAVGFATAAGNGAATPSHIFPLQELSGNYVDTIGAIELAPVASLLQGRTAVGLWDGASAVASKSCETTANSSAATSADAGAFDQSTGSFAALVAVRSKAVTGGGQIVGKRNATAGWMLGQNSIQFNFSLKDTTGLSKAATTPATPQDGAWHAALLVVNRTTGFAHIYSDKGGAVGSVDISALGSLANTAGLAIGLIAGVSSADVGLQVRCLDLFEGAAAEAMGQDELDAWWQNAKDPSGLLTTTSRNSAISVPLGEGIVGHFGGGTALGRTQLPIGYNANFADTDKLGLYCNGAVSNISPHSEDFSQWTNSNTTDTAAFADAPDGFRSAYEVTATASPGSVYRNTGATVAGALYTFSCWVKRNGVSDVAGELVLRDLTDAVQTNAAFVATDTWQRVQVSHAMGASTTLARNYIYVDTSGESILVWGAQTNIGPVPGAYIRTNGAAAALVFSDYAATDGAGVLCKSDYGEIEAVYALAGFGTTNPYIAVASDPATFNSLRGIRAQFGTTPGGLCYNATGSLIGAPGNGVQTLTAETVSTLRWNKDNALAVGSRSLELLFNGAGPGANTTSGAFTASDLATEIAIGNWKSASSANSPDGWIQRVRIWDGERAA